MVGEFRGSGNLHSAVMAFRTLPDNTGLAQRRFEPLSASNARAFVFERRLSADQDFAVGFM